MGIPRPLNLPEPFNHFKPLTFDLPGQLFASCREVQVRRGVRLDGEFYLRVNSRILQVGGPPRRRRLASPRPLTCPVLLLRFTAPT